VTGLLGSAALAGCATQVIDPNGAGVDPNGAGSCSMVQTWDGTSGVDGTNPSTSASFRFNADETWIGGTYKQDPSATEFMHGNYTLAGDTLSLAGAGMGPQCTPSLPATYTATFSSDCTQLALVTKTDDCTGARLYLNASSDGTVMIRR
jgi:hypothetical protein